MALTPDERYQVRNEDVERALRTMAALIEGEVPEGHAWGLFIVPFGEHEAAPAGAGAVYWISSGERAGMLEILQSWITDRKLRLQAQAGPGGK